MTEPNAQPERAASAAERRLLVLAPAGHDAALAREVFARAGIAAHICADVPEVCAELDAGAGALVIAEEATGTDDTDRLTTWLARQPPWSDLPVLLLAQPGADLTTLARAVDVLGHVTVLERPVRGAALVTAVRTALRGRDRQYQARQHLLDREQITAELRTLMDLVPVGVYIAHDPACLRITGNRAGTAILRMPPTSNLSKTAPAAERPTHFQPCRDGAVIPSDQLPVQRAARGETVLNEAIDQVFDDGSIVHTLVSARPLFDTAGAPRGAVASITDVTDLKQAEDDLRRAVADLSEADRRKNEFLAMLAHELRNPLAPIRNSLHILKLAGTADATTIGVHDMIDRQVTHMVRLVDDLLEVSRITRGKIDLRRAPLELASVLRTAVETSRPHLDAANHTLTVDLPAEPLWLDGDAVRLAQVFANLLNNAAKYTAPGGAVSLRARPDGADVVVTVRDTGAGIPAEMLTRVFDLFTQIDRSDARAQGGLGIGLTLVKSLVELHGGRVTVRSDGPGTGSEFEVRLPRTDSTP